MIYEFASSMETFAHFQINEQSISFENIRWMMMTFRSLFHELFDTKFSCNEIFSWTKRHDTKNRCCCFFKKLLFLNLKVRKCDFAFSINLIAIVYKQIQECCMCVFRLVTNHFRVFEIFNERVVRKFRDCLKHCFYSLLYFWI